MRLVIDTDPTVIDILGAPQVEERAAEIVIPQPRDIAATRTLNLQIESTEVLAQLFWNAKREALERWNYRVQRVIGVVDQ